MTSPKRYYVTILHGIDDGFSSLQRGVAQTGDRPPKWIRVDCVGFIMEYGKENSALFEALYQAGQPTAIRALVAMLEQ